ncbi:uncharacterized protein SCHCODRAFT_02644899 [Schizophyllum commune H4-8]|uniref:Expressed protein n=1 Tax=Schizophyllum commune (strain H4-8 / FGSC 9210) TaxID=578458 RepID=D8QKA9_SCHCM|nr:uncharacterized protein SCHCODRAFT_02644899 [Schizophyllum commune H4-8]KAI5885037.1 hypothetical protein SCHCODRAFT_02644899 [Schizophyllum commune H4-8]
MHLSRLNISPDSSTLPPDSGGAPPARPHLVEESGWPARPASYPIRFPPHIPAASHLVSHTHPA